jgi:ribosome-binding protein aMBF1 (putative translation factor)
MTRIRASRPFREYHEEQMRDPEFAAAYRALEPEFQVAREVIRLRLQRGLSQEELAQRVGTGQPNISRLERATINPSLRFLRRIASALDAEVEIRFRPLETTDSEQRV